MKIASRAPHDFYLTFDITDYFDAEHDDFEEIFELGMVRPLTLSERDVLSVIQFNGDPESPEFTVTFPLHDLTEAESNEAEGQVRRIVGADLDLRGLMDQAADDSLLGPLMIEHYGFKRVARASFWEDAFDDIIRTRISHRPTAKRMAQDVRRAYGTHFEFNGKDYFSYPRPSALIGADPEQWRDDWGISRRKAQYVAGLAEELADGTTSLNQLEGLAPDDFYERAQKIRGIGPSTAQDLMIQRNRPDASFPSNEKKGQEKGLRRWIMYSYGVDPDDTSEAEFQALIANWKGYESLAIRFLYINYVVSEKEKQAKKS
jgi:3-methyladenine DNA glycosylase/8-oxoguanine DNA glycosylase